MQPCAVGFEPGLGLFHAGMKVLIERPEIRAVIGLDQVGALVGGDIVKHVRRGQDQAPVIADSGGMSAVGLAA